MTTINTSSVYRITGLASGLDIDQMVTDLMKAHRAPLDKLMQKKQIWQWKQEDYRTINTSLLNLRNEVFKLKLQGSFLVKQVTSSDESIVTATAGASATPGSYQMTVKQLAERVFWQSSKQLNDETENGQTKTLAQQFNITDNSITFTLEGVDKEGKPVSKTFTINPNTDTIYTLVSKINEANLGIVANYDPNYNFFYMTTTSTGSQAKITIQEAKLADNISYFFKDKLQITSPNNPNLFSISSDGSTATATESGKDAVFDFGNLTLNSSTNTIAIAGINLTLKKTGSATITVSNDIDAVVNTIKDFVNKYNETLAAINAELKEERYPDYQPLTDEQIQEGKLTDKQIDQWQEKARSGLLKGDPLLSSAVSSLRAVMSGIVQGVTGQVTVTVGTQKVTTVANSLSVIGITTGTWEEEGKLYLDEARLREALQSNPDAVMELFTRTTDAAGNTLTDPKQKGIAVQLYDAINSAMSRITSQAGSAGSLYDQSYISRTIRDIDRQISDMERRLQELEDRYYRQFTVMEQAIAQMNTQSMWLAQQFAGGGGR